MRYCHRRTKVGTDDFQSSIKPIGLLAGRFVRWMLILVPLWMAAEVNAEVRLAPIFCDHMVIQRAKPVPVWGTAVAGEKVTVQFAGQSHTATAGPRGKWMTRLDALPANAKGRTLVISSDKGANLKINDVLVGEVWLCAGQSNMEMGLGEVVRGAQEIAKADYPGIRLFHVPTNSWRVCSPANIAQGRGTGYGPGGAGGFSAVGYFFGREIHKSLKVPVGLINATQGGTLLDWWTAPDSAQYKQKVAPIVPLAIRGLLWYQGEGDCANHKASTYSERMKAFITGWRKVWGQGDFPVYYVQVTPFNYVKHNRVRTPFELPVLWEAQAEVLSLKNTGMVVTSDLGEADNIHPVKKEAVGHRLALLAMAKTYGKDKLVCSGPVYRSMKVEGDRVRLLFEDTGGGLVSRDGKPLTWFEIAGEDRKFVRAKARIEGKSIVVSSKDVLKPVAVRFGWDQLAQPNLINKEGLPASSFRTENPKRLIGVAYGSHPRQVLDFYQAKSEKPTPVVLYIHGGSWIAGDKRTNPKPFLDKGISVVAINYRYVQNAREGKVEPPVKAPLGDAARALQFVRSMASEWNLDKKRIAATGASAGACSSLWLAFHDDMADPKSEDPVARESTRLYCAAVINAQVSLDPKELREWMPNYGYGAHAFGLPNFQSLIDNREKVLEWIKEYSPIAHVSKDDPPIAMFYTGKKPDLSALPRDPAHSGIMGIKLEERLKAAGVDVVLAHGANWPQPIVKNSEDYLIDRLLK